MVWYKCVVFCRNAETDEDLEDEDENDNRVRKIIFLFL